MNNALKVAIGAAAVVVVAILAISFLPGNGGPGGGGPATSPSATPTSTPLASAASSSAAASPTTLLIGQGSAPLNAGTYSLGQFPVGITFEVTTNWWACSESPVEQGLCYGPPSGPPSQDGGAIAFQIVENVVADPCGSPRTLLDPPVGPSVDDLVTAISNLQGFDVSTPVDYTLDGFEGKQFTFTAPIDSGCTELGTWATELRVNGMGPGEVNEVRILDIGGVRVMIATAHGPDQSAKGRAAVQQVLDSVQIEP